MNIPYIIRYLINNNQVKIFEKCKTKQQDSHEICIQLCNLETIIHNNFSVFFYFTYKVSRTRVQKIKIRTFILFPIFLIYLISNINKLRYILWIFLILHLITNRRKYCFILDTETVFVYLNIYSTQTRTFIYKQFILRVHTQPFFL